MTVRIPGADLTVGFEEGDHLRTEISAKFRLPEFVAEMTANGLSPVRQWSDPDHRFALVLASA